WCQPDTMPGSVRTTPDHIPSVATACWRSMPGVAGPGVRPPGVTPPRRCRSATPAPPPPDPTAGGDPTQDGAVADDRRPAAECRRPGPSGICERGGAPGQPLLVTK